MPRAIINKFDGGQAEDIRTFAVDQHETSVNFDIYTTPHQLRPFVDTVAETVTSGSIRDFAITDIDAIIVSGTTSFVALGQENSGSTKPTFFRKDSASDITSGWQIYATGANDKVAGSLVVYKGFAYCLGDAGSAHNLQKFNGSSSVSTIGTLTNTNYTPIVPKPFVHPEDNVLYFADGNIIGKYDGTTFTATGFTLPSDKVVVSFSSYGTYLVIVCRPKNGVGNSIAYLWGRDTSLTTVQAVIDLGAGQVNIVENLFNNLFFVMTSAPVGQYGNVTQNKLTIKSYGGGAVDIIKEISLSSSLGTAGNIIKQKSGNTLYFGFSNDTAIFMFGKNKDGTFFLSHNRAFPTGATTLNNFNIIGDTFWISFATAAGNYFLHRSLSLTETAAYTTVSSYTTTVNPNMPVEDRYRRKQLDAVSFSFTGGTLNVLQASLDGGAYFDLLSNALTGEVTMPAFNKDDGDNPNEFYEIQFKMKSTGNMKPKELRYRYDIVNTDDI